MRSPWEIDWNDPAQVQSAVRPRIQGPQREPPPVRPIQERTDYLQAQDLESRVRTNPNEEREAEARRRIAEAQAVEAERRAADPTGALGIEQSRATGFYSRGMAANRAYEALGVGAPPIEQTVGRALLPQRLENYILPARREEAEANERGFISSVLRYESGAAIPPEEYNSAQRTYFPQPGDEPGTIAAKARLRAEALEALRIGSGRGAAQVQPAQQDRGGAPPTLGGDRPTSVEQRTMAPGAGGRMELNSDVQSGTNPAIAGLNARVGQMIQQRRPPGEILSYLRERGASPQAVRDIAGQLREIRRFQRENPNYRGPFTVDLERIERQLDPVASTVANVADSALGAGVISGADTLTGGHLDNLVGLTGGDSELANLGIRESRSRHPGASLVGDVGGGASLFGLGRAAASRLGGAAAQGATGTFAPRAIAGDAALGGYVGSGQSGTDVFDPASAGLGVLAAGGGGVAGRGAINTLGRAVSPTGGRLAPLYREGVQPTLGQRIGGAADRFEQATTSVPFLGGLPRRARNNAIEQFQRGAFNQALREIGQELPANVPVGTAAQRFMQRAFNREYEQIRGQMRFAPDNEFGQSYGQILNDVGQLRTDSQNAFRQLVERDLGTRLRASGGTLQGDAYVRVTSRLSARSRAIRRNPSGDHELADAYERLGEALDDAAARNSAPEIAERLTAARRGYQRSVVIEDAARRRGSGTGLFSPTQFDAAVQNIGGGLRSRSYLRGEAPMQDYAAAGLNLGDTLANSGTTDRILASGAIGTAGWASPWTLTPLAASLGANAPGVRQGINTVLAPNRPGMMGLRSQIQDRAYLGGLAGLPIIPQGQ